LFSRQTKATEKLTKLSKTFMFTLKANSKQKRVKKAQEHEKGYDVTVQYFADSEILTDSENVPDKFRQ